MYFHATHETPTLTIETVGHREQWTQARIPNQQSLLVCIIWVRRAAVCYFIRVELNAPLAIKTHAFRESHEAVELH